ncbi:GNAT family N-acetyltransferase [Chryseobacterium sp. A301]
MEFRKANLNDIALIQELAHESWQTAYKSILSEEQIHYMLETMYSESVLTSQLVAKNYCYYLVLRKDKVPVGFLGFEHHYEPLTTKLHRIYLLPSMQGKGYGSRSLEFLKDRTKKHNDSRIVLNVNKNNVAKEYYQRNGFQVYEEGVYDIGSGFVMDDYLMEYTF